MNTSSNDTILRLATRQSGAFSRAQVLATGLTDRVIERRLRARRWERVQPGVYVLVGMPRTFACRLWCASLAVGQPSLVSHEAAAALIGIPGFPGGRPVLTAARGSHHRIEGATVHQLCDVLPEHEEIDEAVGLPRTTIARTIVDLAAVVHVSRLRYALDEVVAARATDETAVARCLGDVARYGKPGVKALGSVLDGRMGGRRPARSVLERHLFRIAEDVGLPAPIPQMRFPGRQELDGCIDGGWPEARLIVEMDGRRWHARISDLKRDRERDAQAARAGWQTLRFMAETVTADAAGVGATIRDTYDLRRQLAA
jgi:predicted transcriptional regulator of viral defense system